MCSLFELTWAGADPVAAAPGPRPGALNRQQQEAVRLLAQGATDESIANRLGVSTRTARRTTNSVLVHLNARSRFQAGVHAVQQGYLPGTPA
jgi:DNA-binding NarL/FixJ family response regulator